MKILHLLIPATTILATLAATPVLGQGCSDAGVCTAGPMGDPLLPDTAYRHTARLGFSYAIGERNVNIIQVIPEVDLYLTHRLRVQAKIPYMAASGNLGDNSGIGDLTLSLTYELMQKGDRSLTALLGTKIPTGKADAVVDEGPLPMPYQTSLGTNDLLVGLNYRTGLWNFALAGQIVLSDQNENGFLRTFWPDNADAQGYFESFYLSRGNDAVLRAQRAFRLGKIAITPGLLGIYRINEDSIVDETYTRVNVEGSSGLTLNLTANVDLPLGDRTALGLVYGSPLAVRDVRPDGLTRSMVVGATVRWRF